MKIEKNNFDVYFSVYFFEYFFNHFFNIMNK